MSTHLGFDVLELDYNRNGPIDDRCVRKFVLLDSRTGKRVSDEQAPAAAPTRPFIWTAIGRDEIASMRTFLDARRGRAVPFWFPTFQWDLSFYGDALEGQTIIPIRWARYVQQMWGTTGGRRHVAVWTPPLPSMDYYRISEATDPGDYQEESITIDPAATRDYPEAGTVISFLRFCRLEEDVAEIRYLSSDVAEAKIHVREIPMEAPT